MKSYFDLLDVFEVLLLTVLVFAVGFLLAIPILIAVSEGEPMFLWMYAAYVVAVVVAYQIKRKC